MSRVRHNRTIFRLTALVFALAFGAMSALAQYGGPSILSRGGNAPGRRGSAPVNFTAYAGANARYETGLVAIQNSTSSDDFGGGAEAGLYGGRNWRKSTFGVDYRGDYRRQIHQRYFNGTNQVASLEYSTAVARRLELLVQQVAGTTNRAFGGFAAPAFSSGDRVGIPLNELFDVRTYFSQSLVAMTWQPTARTSFTGSAQGFFVKREGMSLINSQGYTFSGRAMRRFSRRDSFGMEYQFASFQYPGVYSSSEMQSLSPTWTRQFNRSLSTSLAVGVMGIWSSGVEQYQVSPEIAQFLGRSTVAVAFDRRLLYPRYEGSLLYSWRRSSMNVRSNSGVGAGNGVFLTTRNTSTSAGYSYAGIRRASLGVSGGWTHVESLATTALQGYDALQFGGGFSYRLSEGLNFTTQADYRRFTLPAGQGRNGMGLSFSIAYSTSRLPLAIW